MSRASAGWSPTVAAAAVGLVVRPWFGRAVMTVLLIFTPAVVADEWMLVACGGGVDKDRRAAELKRFWDTVDVLTGSGGFLVCFSLTPLPKRKHASSFVT